MLFRIYRCLVAYEKCIFRKLFSVDLCWGCKLISVFILPSNTIFRKTERELSEREIEEEERGIEHTPLASQAPAREIAPRERSNPEPRLQPRAHFAVRLRRRTQREIEPRAQIATQSPLRRSTSPANPEKDRT